MSLFRFVQWIHEERPLRLYGDGKQTRDFTYVDDIADGTVRGLKPLGYEVINLGGDSPHDLLELDRPGRAGGGQEGPDRVSSHARRRRAWPPGPTSARPSGCSTGSPEVSLAEGVARLCAWYRENRDWAKDIVTED